MRRLILLLACLIGTPHALAEQIRVTTWKLSSSRNAATTTDTEAKQLRDAASVLESLDSDVILLQDVRDRQFCNRLVELLKPATYHVLACSAFQDVPSRGQVAILSKRPAFGAWVENWKSEGAVEPPGGFAFAAIRFGAVDVAFYSIQLKDNEAPGNDEREKQLNILKREICARQLTRHVAAVDGKIANPSKGFVIGGDFNTNPDEVLFIKESTLSILGDSGFTTVFQNIPTERRITRPASARLSGATLDYLFARNADFENPFQITSTRASDRLPVTSNLIVPAMARATERSPLPVLGVTPAELLRDNRLWLGTGAFALLLLAGLTMRGARRRKKAPPEFAVIQFADAYGSRRRRSAANRPPKRAKKAASVLPAVQETASTESTLWQRRALDAERRAERAAAVVKAGLVPHLAQMLKDKLLWRLLTQRSQLAQTQQAGERLMSEFEERLAGIQSQFEIRVRMYERRIAELEREVAAKELELLDAKEAAIRRARESLNPAWPPVFKS